MVANGWCLRRVLRDLEEYTVVVARGGGEKDLALAAREQSLVKCPASKGLDVTASLDSASLHFLNTSAMAQAVSSLQARPAVRSLRIARATVAARVSIV